MSDAFAELLKQVADDCGVTPEEVYREIEAAMAAAIASPDPAVQAIWKDFPCAGAQPTPEEMIAFLSQLALIEQLCRDAAEQQRPLLH